MADYIGITEAQSDPLSPLTSELVKQLRDNPIALAQGATGAPRVRPEALNLLVDEVQLDGEEGIVFTDLEPANTVLEFRNVRTGSTTSNLGLRVQISFDNGVNFVDPLNSGFVSAIGTWNSRGVNGYAHVNPLICYEAKTYALPPIPGDPAIPTPDNYLITTSFFPLSGTLLTDPVNAVRVIFSRISDVSEHRSFDSGADQKIRLYQTGIRPLGGKA